MYVFQSVVMLLCFSECNLFFPHFMTHPVSHQSFFVYFNSGFTENWMLPSPDLLPSILRWIAYMSLLFFFSNDGSPQWKISVGSPSSFFSWRWAFFLCYLGLSGFSFNLGPPNFSAPNVGLTTCTYPLNVMAGLPIILLFSFVRNTDDRHLTFSRKHSPISFFVSPFYLHSSPQFASDITTQCSFPLKW